MTTDDEYYLGLYERHAEAREGRRGRRRVSKANPRSVKRRRGALDAYFNLKSRRYQLWMRQNYLRLLAVVILLFFGGYEIVALRDPLYTATFPESANESLKLANRIENPPPPPPPPPPPTLSSETKVFENKQQIHSDENQKSSDSHATPITSHPLLTTPVNREDFDNDEGQVNNPNNGMSESASNDGSVSISNQNENRPGLLISSSVSLHNSELSPNSLRALKLPKDPNEQNTESLPMDKNKPILNLISDEPADAEQPEVKSEFPESPPKISSFRNKHRSSELRRKSAHSKKRKTKKSLADESGAIPGANENFWNWFQESKGAEGTGASSVECPEESKRLCQMFYKLIRKYKVRTIYDVSCVKNIGWVPIILRKIGNELWGFKYHCGEYDPEKLASAKISLKEFDFVEFDKRMWWKEGFPAEIQLVFAWDVLPHTAYGRVWNFFVNARKQDITYILVDNYPALSNDPSPQRIHINLRRHPFRFPAAKEVVQNVTELNETEKRQLLFYETAMLPDNIG